MRQALSVLFAVLLLGGVVRAEDDVPPAERVSVWTFTPAADGCYVGEAFPVVVAVRYDPAFLEQSGVALFRRELDLPLHVYVPWLQDLAGAQPLTSSEPDTREGLRFALNDEVVSQRPEEEDPSDVDRPHHAVSVRARFAATAPGVLRLPAAVVRFAYATRFEEDFVGGKVALDRKDVTVEGESLAIRVKSLPAAGRPDDFSGAVGRFVVEAESDESAFPQDGLIRLTLRFSGTGNFETWRAPVLSLAGFHVYGMTETTAPSQRTIVYEIAPTAANLTSIPSIDFAYFDPTSGAYASIQTAPIALRSRLPAGAGEVEPPAPVASQDPSDLWRRLRNCGGMLLLATLVGLWVRRRWGRAHPGVSEAAPQEPSTAPEAGLRRARLDSAMEAARAALGSPEALDAFIEYLAVRLDVSPGAVVAPDLDARLRSAGIPADLAGRTARVVEQGTAARYGAPAGEAAGDVLPDAALLDALQEAFGSA